MNTVPVGTFGDAALWRCDAGKTSSSLFGGETHDQAAAECLAAETAPCVTVNQDVGDAFAGRHSGGSEQEAFRVTGGPGTDRLGNGEQAAAL